MRKLLLALVVLSMSMSGGRLFERDRETRYEYRPDSAR